jgi:hypothetical protein
MEKSWSSRGHASALWFVDIALKGALLIASASALATPTVQQVSGTLDHNGSITISGSGFGSKPTAAPWVWDNATASKFTDVWGGAWPDQLPGYNTGYYPPMRGVNPPHSHDTRLIAGAHASNTGAGAGYMVMIFKSLQLPTFPCNFYASWYQLIDKDWHFGTDNNVKTFDYSEGGNPYAANQSWYTNYGPPHPTSNTDTGTQWVTEPGTPLMNPDMNGHNAWWGPAVNPMAGKWAKVEIAFKATDQKDGWITVWENGKKVVWYQGPTDTYPGKLRTIGVGGYSRQQGYTQNWRYFDDVYVDTTLQRVVLADNPVLSQASIIEVQIPVTWSDGSITATVNLGKFNNGQTAYLIVVDSSGAPSAKGYPVTAGGTASAPSPPTAVQVH